MAVYSTPTDVQGLGAACGTQEGRRSSGMEEGKVDGGLGDMTVSSSHTRIYSIQRNYSSENND